MCRGGQGGWDYVHSNNLNPNGKLHAKRMAENKCYRNKVLNSWQTVGTQAARKKYPKSAFYGKKHTEKNKKQHSNFMTGKYIKEKNSQYGTMWIYSDIEKRNAKIDKNSSIPSGWFKGRKNFSS